MAFRPKQLSCRSRNRVPLLAGAARATTSKGPPLPPPSVPNRRRRGRGFSIVAVSQCRLRLPLRLTGVVNVPGRAWRSFRSVPCLLRRSFDGAKWWTSHGGWGGRNGIFEGRRSDQSVDGKPVRTPMELARRVVGQIGKVHSAFNAVDFATEM